MARCTSKTLNGHRCKNSTTNNTELCWTHTPKEINTCGICLDERYKYSINNKRLLCEHTFCIDCINTWIVKHNSVPTCPICRASIPDIVKFSAMYWGEQNGLIYRVEVNYYPLDSLSDPEFIFLHTLFEASTAFTESQFHRVCESFKSMNNFSIEKIKQFAIKKTEIIKKNELIENPGVLHAFIF